MFLYSGIFTKEYETNTLILILTKGLSRYKVVFAKFFVMFTMWTIGYLLCFAVTYGYNAFFWDNSIAVGLLPAMVHWWLFGVWIIGLIVLFSVLVKSYTGVLLGTGGSVLGVYLISFFPKAWKYTPTKMCIRDRYKPAFVIGVPVGFVNVEAAKELIMETGVPYICLLYTSRCV